MRGTVIFSGLSYCGWFVVFSLDMTTRVGRGVTWTVGLRVLRDRCLGRGDRSATGCRLSSAFAVFVILLSNSELPGYAIRCAATIRSRIASVSSARVSDFKDSRTSKVSSSEWSTGNGDRRVIPVSGPAMLLDGRFTPLWAS